MEAALRRGLPIEGLPLNPSVRHKLQCAGFRTTAELEAVAGPVDLAAEAQLTHEEALLALKLVAPTAGTAAAAATAASVPLSARQIFEREAAAKRIITFAAELDGILGGGVETGAITEFCGVPGVGKTQLGMQLALDVQLPAAFGGVAGTAVYIDTEGSFMLERCCQMADAFVAHLQRAAAKKQDPARIAAAAALTREALLAGIHYFRVRDHIEQLAAVEMLPSFLAQHPTIRLVVVDSVTFHFRQEYGDMAARTRQLAQMAQQLMQLAGERDVAVVLMNQVTTKLEGGGGGGSGGGGSRGEGASDVAARLVPALGDSWAHAATARVILHWHEGKRRAFIYKSPTQPAAAGEYTVTKEGVRGLPSAHRQGGSKRARPEG